MIVGAGWKRVICHFQQGVSQLVTEFLNNSSCQAVTCPLPRSSFPPWLLALAALAVFPWLPPVDGRLEHSILVLASGQNISL